MADTPTLANLHAYKVCALKELQPYERNPRTHSDQQIAQIRKSISEFGFTNPLLIDEANNIIAGHGRYLAAAAEGLREVPCIVIAGLSDAQRRGLVIADNQIALNAGWDDELLRAEIAAIADAGVELQLLGFNEAELARYSGEAAKDLEAEWRDMPEFEQPNKMAYRSIIIHFAGPEAVREFAKLMRQNCTDATKFMWFPAQPRESAGQYIGHDS